jgi:hypothetical protein
MPRREVTRREIADCVLVQLRACGPQPLSEIRVDLGLTQREAEYAIYDLMNRRAIEYDHPTRSPLVYKASKT